MARSGWIAPLVTFTILPVTVWSILLFVGAIFSSVLFFERLPHVPKPDHQHGLDLEAAYKDLQSITSFPHPYNSHQNDVVRGYILDRVQRIAANHSFVHIDNDLVSNFTWPSGSVATYYEGNNILVRIQGTSSMPAVLFSAHFDSVSTAPGATDDGMGVATLIQLVDFFTKNRPKRDVIFNINNGEEDGLLGAKVFAAHPWALMSSSFLNLEGAGGGSRPVLFRSSTAAVARALWSAPHPHGNVLAENAFTRGLIRSGTDYSVYTEWGIPGLDLAFYRHRAVYHTKDDSVATLNGKGPLWNMLETAFYVGSTLASDGNLDDKNEGQKAVYFDLFGEAFVVSSISTFMAINIALLVVGPLVVGTLIYLAHRRSKLYWTRRGWIRFPIAPVLGFAAPLAFAFLVNWANPYIAYSNPYSILAMQISLASIVLYLPLRLLAHYRPIFRQKTIVLVQLFVLAWVLLVLDTILVSIPQIGGLYFFTFLNAGVLLALVLALSEQFELPPSLQSRLVKHVRRDATDDSEQVEVTREPTEATPLLSGREEEAVRDETVDEENQYILWVFQIIFSFPFSAILLTHINCLLLAALQHTTADGSPSFTIHLAVALLSTFTVLPLSPFLHKIHRLVIAFALAVFVITALVNIFAFPFSPTSPLKVRFRQAIDLDFGSNSVQLSGLPGYLDRKIIPELPSSIAEHVSCYDEPTGLRTCGWAGLEPHSAPGAPSSWLSLNSTLVKPGFGRIEIEGANSRHCTVAFHSHVHNIQVHGSAGFREDQPMPEGGVTRLDLWSRSWNRAFQVEASWDGNAHMEGMVTCSWDEVSSIPALSEAITFVPRWSTVTKAKSGIVDVSKRFSI